MISKVVRPPQPAWNTETNQAKTNPRRRKNLERPPYDVNASEMRRAESIPYSV